MKANTAPVTFQVILHEGSNVIEVRYLDVYSKGDIGMNGTGAGIESPDGKEGIWLEEIEKQGRIQNLTVQYIPDDYQPNPQPQPDPNPDPVPTPTPDPAPEPQPNPAPEPTPTGECRCTLTEFQEKVPLKSIFFGKGYLQKDVEAAFKTCNGKEN
ncbi:MAG: hypothetical protein JW884_06250 [Deltaproteobacteria bacterium]|nr:hypothetical protein [Deltaproteobacteria bacterium]